MEEAADLQLQQSPRKRQRVNGSDGTAATSSSQPASSKSKAVAPSSADVAACPICNRTFKAGRVLEAHVNRCIDNPPPASAAQEVPVMQQQPQQAQRPVQKKPHKGVPQLKVPAKIAFHLFNDRKLRDKLKDVSLPIVGKRKVCSQVTRDHFALLLCISVHKIYLLRPLCMLQHDRHANVTLFLHEGGPPPLAPLPPRNKGLQYRDSCCLLFLTARMSLTYN